ncbi:MAG: hypothetical protein Q8S57_11750 [Methanoregula sp.]|nr:hypothetical protein [Methanoregula sp.]
MGDSDISVNSVVLALLSDIEMSSAIMMKDAYLPDSGEKTDEKRSGPGSKPDNSPQDEGLAGPNVSVYITKISNQTPPEEIEKILKKDPYRKTNTGAYDFYTIVLSISMRPGDPKTTRFINGTIELAFLRGIKILNYSPKEKGIITAIIEKGGDAISLSPGLDFSASSSQGKKTQSYPDEKRFGIPVGPDEKITGTYSEKSGHSLDIPPCVLLDYRGMLKNEREMFWEIYPPMPGQHIEVTGKEMQAVFSFIVQTPKNTLPKITASIEGRVKGNLWGVVPIKGSVVL